MNLTMFRPLQIIMYKLLSGSDDQTLPSILFERKAMYLIHIPFALRGIGSLQNVWRLVQAVKG